MLNGFWHEPALTTPAGVVVELDACRALFHGYLGQLMFNEPSNNLVFLGFILPCRLQACLLPQVVVYVDPRWLELGCIPQVI